ncbi:hypothetical protein [Achromobacter xylosoxidans]|nr:hypothetical protein [Achromobacter xylosoxidans]MCZ8391355.1 hypothetical protein [Achromobacter xylosoxidans]
MRDFGAQHGASEIQIFRDPKKELFIPGTLRYCAGIARPTGPHDEGDPVS